MTGASGVLLVICTAPAAEARGLVDQLLEERLIACANLVGPVESRYRWEGQVESAEEIVLWMKTTAARVEELRSRIVALHSYSVPEILELEVASGLPAYLGWVSESCEPPGFE